MRVHNDLSTTTMFNIAKNAHFNGNLTLLAQISAPTKERDLAKHKLRRI